MDTELEKEKKEAIYYKQLMPNKLWKISLEMLLKFSSNLYLLMCLIFTAAEGRSWKANAPCGVCVWGQGERFTDEVHGPRRKSPLSRLRPWEVPVFLGLILKAPECGSWSPWQHSAASDISEPGLIWGTIKSYSPEVRLSKYCLCLSQHRQSNSENVLD